MSAFASSGQVNSWLCFKHFLQALPSKAGGTTVRTTDGMVEVRAGLSPGEKVVTSGTVFIDRAARAD